MIRSSTTARHLGSSQAPSLSNAKAIWRPEIPQKGTLSQSPCTISPITRRRRRSCNGSHAKIRQAPLEERTAIPIPRYLPRRRWLAPYHDALNQHRRLDLSGALWFSKGGKHALLVPVQQKNLLDQ